MMDKRENKAEHGDYEAPALVVLGTIREVTAGAVIGASDAGVLS